MRTGSTALVTLALGDAYRRRFDRVCKPAWERYCARHGIDLIVLTAPLDASLRAASRSPSWQRLLILSQRWSANYERVIWADADVVVNEAAPDIVAGTPAELVCGVDAYAIPDRDTHRRALERQYAVWARDGVPYLDNPTPGSFYTRRGLRGEALDLVLQPGVFVASPRHHRDVFEHIYNSFEDDKGPEWNYEMPAMSFELVRNALLHVIPSRFNWCVLDLLAAEHPALLGSRISRLGRLRARLGLPQSRAMTRAVRDIHSRGYFTHFAACAHLMPILAAISGR